MPLPAETNAFLEDHELVDPKTFEVLVLSDDGAWLVAPTTGRRFPIVDGIPQLLESEADPLPGVR